MMDNDLREDDKWTYIQLISEFTDDDKYGQRLMQLMDMAGVTSTREVTEEQAHIFYDMLLENWMSGTQSI